MLVEAVTYRFRGHSVADPEVYRTKEEVEEWRQRDPIVQFADRLIGGGAITGADAEAARPARARERSTRPCSSPTPRRSPTLDSLYDDVYVLGDQLRGWYAVDERSPDTHARRDRAPATPSSSAWPRPAPRTPRAQSPTSRLVMREGFARDMPGPTAASDPAAA